MSPTPYVLTFGWALLPILLAVILLTVMTMGLKLLGFQHYWDSTRMPFAGTCSRAISAAFHPLPDRRHTEALEKIQYGVIADLGDGKEHVGFSSTEVKPLIKGGEYY